MPYSDDDLERMHAAYDDWLEREDRVTIQLMTRRYTDPRTKEVVNHGFSRRIATLKHCIERVFETAPPQAEKLTSEESMDATSFIQCFYINVYGILDNIARIWSYEANLTGPDGRQLRDNQIGLSARSAVVRRSFSPSFAAYLDKTAEWQKYLENYRHALAHRIPLYIPPQTLNDEQISEAQNLQDKINDAYREKRYIDVSPLRARQVQLGKFEPLIMHSFSEGARPVRFHGQMINDFCTVIELSEKFIEELDAQHPEPEQRNDEP